MSVGIYGSIRPADVNINDIDIFYTYVPNREATPGDVYRLTTEDVLTYKYLPSDEQLPDNENLLTGLYNLKLPATVFNQTGIYTIYIKPKEIKTIIIDCNVLAALPNINGIVIDTTKISDELSTNNALQGYRIEYINDDGTKLRNVSRFVVTSNKVVPVTQNIGDTNQKSIRYRFDDSGTLLFLQLTPSSASDIKPNLLPFIGKPGQKIIISNTFFNPLAIEVELVENTIDTIVNIVGGEQIKDVDNGILTYFDENRNIIKQFDLFEIKDDVTYTPLYEVKEKRQNIDGNQNFDDVVGDL